MSLSQEPAKNASAALVQDWRSRKALKKSRAAQREVWGLSQTVETEKRRPRTSRADVRFLPSSPYSLS